MGRIKTGEEKARLHQAKTPVNFEDLQKVAVTWILDNKGRMFQDLENALLIADGQELVYSKEKADKPLCQWMALAYAAGYKQAKEAPLNQKRLIYAP